MTLPEDRTIALDRFPEKIQKFMSPRAPASMKMMLARGLVPMKPLVQLCALHQLALSNDDQVRETARTSARKLPPVTLVQLAGEPLLPIVLDWMAEIFSSSREIVRALLLNRQTDNDTFIRLAREGDEDICEIIARNQQRLLEEPKLVETLYFNRNLRASTADRMIDFAARNGLDISGIPCADEVIAAVQGQVDRSAEEDARLDQIFAEAQKAIDELKRDLDDEEVADQVEEAEKAPDRRSAAGRIREMNTAQRIRMALLGTKTERAILIRDANKMVARAVIRSPQISAQEAIIYARNRSLIDEVITYISNNKKWTRNYAMKLALVNNPKTPIGTALSFLNFMRPVDLRAVSRSRNVSQPIARAAKQLLKARMK